MTRYLVDSNVLIESNNHYYGMDFCPAFWDWLVSRENTGRIASIENVLEEILRRKDAVSDWSLENKSFFLTLDDTVKHTTHKLSDWVHSANYEIEAIVEFLNSADYWLICFAMVHDYTVVTQEIPANTLRKVKIPNACNAFNVPWINTFQMLRTESPKFVLAK